LYTDNDEVYTIVKKGLTVDGEEQSLAYSDSLIAVKNQSYIYVKDYANAFGLKLELDDSNNITLSNQSISIKIDNKSKKIYLNGVYTKSNAVKVAGYMFIPIRPAVQWIGAEIRSIDESFHIETK